MNGLGAKTDDHAGSAAFDVAPSPPTRPNVDARMSAPNPAPAASGGDASDGFVVDICDHGGGDAEHCGGV